MKKFRFSLKSVQTVRNLKELKARESFSEALHRRRLAETALDLERGRLRSLEELLRQDRSGTLRGQDQVSYLREYDLIRLSEKAAEQALQQAQAQLDACRETWIQARRDVRVIENLEQKARLLHRLEVEREEQAAMDDRTNALAGRAPLLMS